MTKDKLFYIAQNIMIQVSGILLCILSILRMLSDNIFVLTSSYKTVIICMFLPYCYLQREK